MARRIRIAALGSLAVAALLATVLGGAYFAARQVRPFYEQALRMEPEVLERGSRELESRATALYSDARQHGQWQALFTAEQINGWLATQLAENKASGLPKNFRNPRVAMARDQLTLGFRTTSGGVDTVVSVDASVFLTAEGAVAIQFMSVRAGALPLPVMKLADEIAAACKKVKPSPPVQWTRQDGQPVAIVKLHSDQTKDKRHFFIDTIELGDGELYVAGHTQIGNESRPTSPKVAARPLAADRKMIELGDYELRLTPNHQRGALEIARRPTPPPAKDAKSAKF